MKERTRKREPRGAGGGGGGKKRRGGGRRDKEGWRTKGGGKGEPEHFVKQGKMRLRRGTTATFLSLQNYVFRGPPPYLSKHNKFPLCLSRSSSTSSSTVVSSSATPALPRRLFFRRSLPESATGTRLSFFHAGAIDLPLSCNAAPCLPRSNVAASVRLRPPPHPHTATRSTSFRGSIHVHRFPPTSSSR